MIKIHGVHGSPFVRKVLVALALKDLEYEQLPQMPFTQDDEFAKISPLGKIPAMEDGDLTVSDSSIICEYLEDAYPGYGLYPASPADKARARWYEELGDSRIAELAAGIFFQRFMRPMAFQQDPDEELVAKIIDKQLPPVQDYLETQVPDSEFLFGEFCMADLGLVSPFFNAGYAGYAIDADRWPKAAAFVDRVREQSQVSGVLEAEGKALGIQ
ncbi:MAG: glutathione S-transferase family protein [Pseudomonadota bacterium]